MSGRRRSSAGTRGTAPAKWVASSGLEIAGQLFCEQYGMTFNQALGSGKALVADKVKLALGTWAVKQA